ncbi:MAG: DNA gyrase subunit A [Candidatus Muirbacterium halophilum]|nr:DNA gyrase subunit A [Candidatus Muirbacterium halophilum]MCK9475774.1 DNA gyrase subunit A [Candidatus Muirbacterium halophilum]
MDEIIRDKIEKIYIEDIMKDSYLDYAMSVIVSRALPDVRDGLKPVHRRILFAMNDLGMSSTKPYKKSARIVGDVLGKYHPHGDTSVYDAMVRMAQDFSSRYLFVDGHGNFGSVDGDSAAAMRYTEVRMGKIAEQMLEDIDKETVDYKLNFDESLNEPIILPAKIPALLMNGASGIAVGMATNIPPHNLGELVDGVSALIENPDLETSDLMEYIKGPDFPTGGIIMGREGIKSAYSTGRGKIKVRAKIEIEEKKGKEVIIVNELPYMVNKANLIIKIADLVKDKKIEGISDIRDESDRQGMRIVIECKRDFNANVVVNNLYKHTEMQSTFGTIMIALVDGEPKLLNLKQILEYFIDHRKNVIIRRTAFELNKAEEKAHLLEGLLIAIDNIDEVISIIRGSDTADIAKERLIERFELSERQAKAILDMRLHRLTGLERDKIQLDYDETIKLIQELKSILGSTQKVLDIIKSELDEIKKKFADKRRTEIGRSIDILEDIDLIQNEKVVVTISNSGYIKTLPIDTYKKQKRGGKGITGGKLKDDDYSEHLLVADTHDYLMIFTSVGKVYLKRTFEVPMSSRISKGKALVNFLEIDREEEVKAIIPIQNFDSELNVLMITRKGVVKKTSVLNYRNIRKGGIIAIRLDEGDELIETLLTTGNMEILIATKYGKAIRFNEEQARPMGRATRGVRGIRLKNEDVVIGATASDDPEKTVLTITKKGFGKRTQVENYRLINRGGSGVINIKLTDKTGDVISIAQVEDKDELLMISKDGMIIRTPISQLRSMGRATQGNILMRLNSGDEVVATEIIKPDDDEDFIDVENLEKSENLENQDNLENPENSEKQDNPDKPEKPEE